MSRQPSESFEPRHRYRAKRPVEGIDGVKSQRAKRARSASMPSPPTPIHSAPPTSEHSERESRPEDQDADTVGTSALSQSYITTADGLSSGSPLSQDHLPVASVIPTLSWSPPAPQTSLGLAITTAGDEILYGWEPEQSSGLPFGQALTTHTAQCDPPATASVSSDNTVDETGMTAASSRSLSRKRQHRACTVMPATISVQQTGSKAPTRDSRLDAQATEACGSLNEERSCLPVEHGASRCVQYASRAGRGASSAQPDRPTTADLAEPVMSAAEASDPAAHVATAIDTDTDEATIYRPSRFRGWVPVWLGVSTPLGFGTGQDEQLYGTKIPTDVSVADDRTVLVNKHTMRVRVGDEAHALLSENDTRRGSCSKKSRLRRLQSVKSLIKK